MTPSRVCLLVAICWILLGCAAARTPAPPPQSVVPVAPVAEVALSVAEPSEPAAIGAEIGVAVEGPERPSGWLGAAGESRYVLHTGSEQMIAAWVDVPPARPDANVRTAVTLSIDTSGSMSGGKIARARAAARVLVHNLADGDVVAIHAFSHESREIVAPTVLSPESRPYVDRTIARLSAGGGTNLYEALLRAEVRARRAPATHSVRRVVLISDGRATVGETSAHALAAIDERGARHGVQVTALGVGLDYDEYTLNALAVRSSGRLYHLSDARELPSIVEHEVALLKSTRATNAYLELAPAAGVRLLGAEGVRYEWAGGGALRVPLGVLHAGQRREVLVRLRAEMAAEGSRAVSSVRLYFDDPSDGGVQRVEEVVVRGQMTGDAALVQAHPNRPVQAIIAMQRASAVAAEARAKVDAGDFAGADADLAVVEAQMQANAAQARDRQERERLMAVARGLSRSRRAVQAAPAKPAARQPAVRRQLSLELNDVAMDAMGF